MNHILSNLIIYGDLPKDCILMELGKICKNLEEGTMSKDILKNNAYKQVKRLLEVATQYGFNKNLWHNYLTFLLITDENPFSLTCEKVGAHRGSVNEFAKNDFEVFKALFDYDFTHLEEALEINCFTQLSKYQAIPKKEMMYNKNVSEKVQELSNQLAAAQDKEAFFDCITEFYKQYGVGMFGLNKAFRLGKADSEGIQILPINNMDQVYLKDLIGYEWQKKELVDNTRAFIEGKKANNVLLFGDSGTGKSTSIKAIVNEFYEDGLRMIEIYKHQFKELSEVIGQIKNRNYKFIIYMDDLSFEEFEIEYKFLKAVIEGGVETRPDNILIYATSNRRHLIKESWKDKNDMEHDEEIHRSDTIEEKLSLAHRFGVTIYYGKPNKHEYDAMVVTLARKAGLNLSDDVLRAEANKWELRHGGLSGRTAQQFINYLVSIE